jgi:hypothetical protein
MANKRRALAQDLPFRPSFKLRIQVHEAIFDIPASPKVPTNPNRPKLAFCTKSSLNPF